MKPRPKRPKARPRPGGKPPGKRFAARAKDPSEAANKAPAPQERRPSPSAKPGPKKNEGHRGRSHQGPSKPPRRDGARRPPVRATQGTLPPGAVLVGAPRPTPNRPTSPDALHVASVGTLSIAVVAAAELAERAVFDEHKRGDRAIASALRLRRDLAAPDHRFVAQAVFALLRWHGWVEPLQLPRIEERLLLSWILDATTIHPVCRHWAKLIARDPSRLVAVGDAPNWTARAEGLKRWVNGRAVNADPWRLFPDWIRMHLPLPPGGASPKTRALFLLDALQRRPLLWVRAQGRPPEEIWGELRDVGVTPWVHRQMTATARLEADCDLYHLETFKNGFLEIQDLASQTVGLVCDPDPGERWWDACAGAGGKALHLASLMNGRGVVVATDTSELRLKEAVRRARRSPFRNITTKVWDGKGVAGKAKSFDGVLVDAPCSAIGTWRRNPDARWTIDDQAVGRLAEIQLRLLRAAADGVKPGGNLVYSVCTITPTETTGIVRRFLEARPEFRLEPFTNPLNNEATDGQLLVWPQDADSDAMFVAKMTRG